MSLRSQAQDDRLMELTDVTSYRGNIENFHSLSLLRVSQILLDQRPHPLPVSFSGEAVVGG